MILARSRPASTDTQPAPAGRKRLDPRHTVIEVLGEYVATDQTLDHHLHAIDTWLDQHGWARPLFIGVDPAGAARNSQTGLRDVDLLRQRGWKTRFRQSRIEDGIRLVRARLDHHTLRIHPRCNQLIEALASYHFDPRHPHNPAPVKDGPDHLCDALRYMLINFENNTPTTSKRYR